MALVDDRVLEYLEEHESGSPEEMRQKGPIHYSRQYIGRRCKKLADKGLVKHLGNGIYIITDDGEAYLGGRLDTQEWRYIEDDADDVSIDSATDREHGNSPANGGPM
nr:helix-turn-helix domain-containing protein [Halorubrum aidingense]